MKNKELEKFLQTEGVLTKFKHNCKYVIDGDEDAYDLWSAFAWAQSPEGSGFWADLQIKFDTIKSKKAK